MRRVKHSQLHIHLSQFILRYLYLFEVGDHTWELHNGRPYHKEAFPATVNLTPKSIKVYIDKVEEI